MPRPSLYTVELGDAICDRIPSEPLTRILDDDNMPSYSTVMSWVRTHPDFMLKYTRAREDQGDYDADKVAEIRQQVLAGTLAPDAARVAIDACKWTSGKRRPKVYGDRVALEHAGRISLESLIVDSLKPAT